jgi:hypothetical protein
VQREQYAGGGDEDMLRVIAELFENTSGQLVRVPAGLGAAATERVHGCVHEVESVRRRCALRQPARAVCCVCCAGQLQSAL